MPDHEGVVTRVGGMVGRAYATGAARLRRELKAHAASAAAGQAAGTAPHLAWLADARWETLVTNSRAAVALTPWVGGEGWAVIKVATDGASSRDLVTEAQRIDQMRAEASLEPWWDFLPRVVAQRAGARGSFTLVASPSRLTALAALNAPGGSPDALLDGALEAMATLRRLSSRVVGIDDDLIRRTVAEPFELVGRSWPEMPHARADLAALERVSAALARGLSRRSAVVGWTHGDYWLDNVLVDPRSSRVVGVIDWGGSSPHGLVGTDPTLAVLAELGRRTGGDVSAAVARLVAVAAGGFSATEERSMADRLVEAWPPSQGLTWLQGVMLTWAAHAAHLVTKRSRSPLAPGHWVHRRFTPVVRALADEDLSLFEAPARP